MLENLDGSLSTEAIVKVLQEKTARYGFNQELLSLISMYICVYASFFPFPVNFYAFIDLCEKKL